VGRRTYEPDEIIALVLALATGVLVVSWLRLI